MEAKWDPEKSVTAKPCLLYIHSTYLVFRVLFVFKHIVVIVIYTYTCTCSTYIYVTYYVVYLYVNCLIFVPKLVHHAIGFFSQEYYDHNVSLKCITRRWVFILLLGFIRLAFGKPCAHIVRLNVIKSFGLFVSYSLTSFRPIYKIKCSYKLSYVLNCKRQKKSQENLIVDINNRWCLFCINYFDTIHLYLLAPTPAHPLVQLPKAYLAWSGNRFPLLPLT